MIQVNLTDAEYDIVYSHLRAALSQMKQHPELLVLLDSLEDARRVAKIGYITREMNDRALLENFVLAMEDENQSLALQDLFLKVKDHLNA